MAGFSSIVRSNSAVVCSNLLYTNFRTVNE